MSHVSVVVVGGDNDIHVMDSSLEVNGGHATSSSSQSHATSSPSSSSHASIEQPPSTLIIPGKKNYVKIKELSLNHGFFVKSRFFRGITLLCIITFFREITFFRKITPFS